MQSAKRNFSWREQLPRNRKGSPQTWSCTPFLFFNCRQRTVCSHTCVEGKWPRSAGSEESITWPHLKQHRNSITVAVNASEIIIQFKRLLMKLYIIEWICERIMTIVLAWFYLDFEWVSGICEFKFLLRFHVLCGTTTVIGKRENDLKHYRAFCSFLWTWKSVFERSISNVNEMLPVYDIYTYIHLLFIFFF